MPGRTLPETLAALGAALAARALAAGPGGERAGGAGAAPGPAPLPPAIRELMAGPQYRNARWSLYVADRATGEPLYDLTGGELVLPASTTKLFSTAAALDAYGPDFRFETPVYRRGAVDGQGALPGRPDPGGQRRPDHGRAQHARGHDRLHLDRPHLGQRASPAPP